MGPKFKKWMEWLGIPSQEIQNLRLQSLKFLDQEKRLKKVPEKKPIEFQVRQLPNEVITFRDLVSWRMMGGELTPEMKAVVEYAINGRKLNQKEHIDHLALSTSTTMDLNTRLIILFKYNGQVVGYTARAVGNAKKRYLSSHDANFVFNLDAQTPNRKFVIVCEGPIDALMVDGVAVCTNEISERKAEIINSLNREVIVVPDVNKPGLQMIHDALKYGWSVSFPQWQTNADDINQAVIKLGVFDTFEQILKGKISNQLKIKLLEKDLRRYILRRDEGNKLHE